MKRVLYLFCLSILSVGVFAQDNGSVEDKLSVGLSLNADAFFGFNPMMTIGYDLGKGSLTAYGIQWGAGTGSDWGQWTEVGFGYNFPVGTFDINPQLGFTFGSLLSSGAAERGVVGDGIVPNLTINHDSDKFEGQFYFGYYLALSDNTEVAGQATNNYIHYWANAGYKASPILSFGAHFEHLELTGGEINGGGDLDSVVGYLWLGPYVQLTKGNTGLRLSAGGNLADDNERFAQNDFYKLAFFFSL